MSRLHVLINDETHQAITDLMAEDVTATEVVRRAISCYSFIKAEQKDGYNLMIVGEHGHQRKVEFI